MLDCAAILGRLAAGGWTTQRLQGVSYGYGRTVGLPPRWPIRWNGTPIRSVIGWKTSANAARRDWVREEVTAIICFGTAAKVREKMDSFFAGLAKRAAEVQRRCRTALQAQADALIAAANQLFGQTNHVDLTLVSV